MTCCRITCVSALSEQDNGDLSGLWAMALMSPPSQSLWSKVLGTIGDLKNYDWTYVVMGNFNSP